MFKSRALAKVVNVTVVKSELRLALVRLAQPESLALRSANINFIAKLRTRTPYGEAPQNNVLLTPKMCIVNSDSEVKVRTCFPVRHNCITLESLIQAVSSASMATPLSIQLNE